MKLQPKNTRESFISHYRPLVGIFQVLLYFPFAWNARTKLTLKIVSKVYYLVAIPGCFLWTIQSISQEQSGEQTVNTVATKALLIVNLLAVWVHAIEADVTASSQALIYTKLNDIDEYYHSQLSAFSSTNGVTHINYALERRQVWSKFGAMIGAASILELISLGIGENLGNIRLLFVVTDILNYVRCLQVLALIDFVRRRVALLSPLVKQDQKRIFAIDLIGYQQRPTLQVDMIKRAKSMYGRLHEVFELLNGCFGWSLLLLATFFFLDFTCSFYWLYLRYQKPESVFEALYSIIPKASLLLMLCTSIRNCNNHVRL